MKRFLTVFILVISILLISCNTSVSTKNKSLEYKNSITVSILDVGQGDAILIKTPNGKFILIDSGSNSAREQLNKKLSQNGVSRIELLVATHPHEDHIGNMDYVIKNYYIKDIYMPKVVSTTKTFKDMMQEIKNKNLKINTAKAGIKINIDGVNIEFLAPVNSKYEEINNYSAVVKVTFGRNKFLFMGDAEKLSEDEILNSGQAVIADVIKLGHHGSSSSSSKKFIQAVNPKYAVISVGYKNSYGHPHKETLKLMGDLKINVLRTDKNGDIVFTSDGQNLVYKNK